MGASFCLYVFVCGYSKSNKQVRSCDSFSMGLNRSGTYSGERKIIRPELSKDPVAMIFGVKFLTQKHTVSFKRYFIYQR